ncbi:hypothetical protein SGFS_099410 [Streptomyces graminofaciens]|uniref:Uncharacterized protein n=1 Tax=Streptomyces graminofaciens TaxID=68212 RepID=A0ABM7FR10_9ACTN|nr:hypothetical protein [Streptomyces graminofaciens]BBC38647.1 hypothetical protein SGFS_099410 [Streptomyces graminofaciens]
MDHAVGYAHSDMGTLRIHSPLLRAPRVQTLALSSTLMPGMAVHHDLLHRHGGTDVRRQVPLQALPGFHRTPGEFQPLRQITGVARSILYYDAQGDAGLPRGWVILGLGLAVACLFGFGVTRFYDRKGLHRNPADKEPQPVLARTQTDDP